MSKKVSEQLERERAIMATLSLHLSDDDVIAISEQADKEDDRMAYLESQYERVKQEKPDDTAEADLLRKYRLGVEVCKRKYRVRGQAEPVEEVVGYFITQERNGGYWYADRTHGFTKHQGLLTPFETEHAAISSAIQYATCIEASSKQFSHVPRMVLLKLPVCASVPKPDKGMLLQVHLDAEQTHALSMIREGCLSSNTLGPGRTVVDSIPDVIRKIIGDVLTTVQPKAPII